jgi:hypothetical protein
MSGTMFAANQGPLSGGGSIGGAALVVGPQWLVCLRRPGQKEHTLEKGKAKDRRPQYEPPRVLASYTLEELQETIRPHGPESVHAGGGCGCGCGGS